MLDIIIYSISKCGKDLRQELLVLHLSVQHTESNVLIITFACVCHHRGVERNLIRTVCCNVLTTHMPKHPPMMGGTIILM